MSALEPGVRIDTPENVMLDVQVAGLGSRSIAAFVDYLIAIVALTVLGLILGDASFGTSGKGRWAFALYLLVLSGVFMFYHLIFEFLWNGQTPGKRLLNIRVVQSNGMPLTTTGLVIRNLVRLFDFLPLFYGIGLIAMFTTRHAQRLGDLAAGTIVIREQPELSPRDLRDELTVHYAFVRLNQELPSYIDISRITEQDRLMIINYLQRRGDLSGRERIALSLAERVAEKMGIAGAVRFTYLHVAEEFLEQVVRAFELAERQHGDRSPVPSQTYEP